MKNKNGFTLVELLCVIAVMAILGVMVTSNVLTSLNNSRKSAMIIQEAQVADAGSLLIKDYCEYPLDSSYKSECSTLVKKSNASTNKNNIVEKYTCIEDLKSKKYYEDELTYSGVECNGVVVYQYDEDNGKYISKNTYISCGDSYVSEGIEKGQIDLNNYPGCNGLVYPTKYYYLVYNDNSTGATKEQCLYEQSGSDTPKSGCVKESTYKVASNTFKKTHYLFNSWNSAIDGSGVKYNVNDSLTGKIKEDKSNKEKINLYAQWVEHVYAINYNLNGGEYGSLHPANTTYDTLIQISKPTKHGYTFTGWSVTSGLSNDSAKYQTSATSNKINITSSSTKVNAEYFYNLTKVNNGSVTLLANYDPVVMTVNFDAAGGSVNTSQKQVKYSLTYGDLPTPTKSGYIFIGWYLSTLKVESNTVVTNVLNHTLIAHWEDERIKYVTLSGSYKCSNKSAGSAPYIFTYAGACDVIDDGNQNWKIYLYGDASSGSGTHNLSFNKNVKLDIFLVGGGYNGYSGSSSYCSDYGYNCLGVGGTGGSGGKINMISSQNITAGTYPTVVGGSASDSSIFNFSSANGTIKAFGGGGGGVYGYGYGGASVGNGSNGGTGVYEFFGSSGTIYGSGGGGGGGSADFNHCWCCEGDGYYCDGEGSVAGSGGIGGSGAGNGGGSGKAGTKNTGGGGGGANGRVSGGALGGSGIIIIRNAR